MPAVFLIQPLSDDPNRFICGDAVKKRDDIKSYKFLRSRYLQILDLSDKVNAILDMAFRFTNR